MNYCLAQHKTQIEENRRYDDRVSSSFYYRIPKLEDYLLLPNEMIFFLLKLNNKGSRATQDRELQNEV